MRVAALDLGTNSFLCLIADVTNGKIQEVSDEMEIVRLGEGLSQQKPGEKKFHPEALKRARRALEKFSKSIQKHKPEKILAVATSAARDASNVEDLQKIARALSIPLEIISGKREADLTFQGAVIDELDSDNALVIDIGGGSTEILSMSEGKELVAESLDIGGVRLLEMYLKDDPPSQEQLAAMDAYIDAQFSTLPIHNQGHKLIAVAGTPTTLAAIQYNIDAYDPHKIHYKVMSVQQLEKLFNKMTMLSIEQRKLIPGLNPKRADIIIVGTRILQKFMEAFGFSEVTVSVKGLRYGVARFLEESR